jgi:hypothetical protein
MVALRRDKMSQHPNVILAVALTPDDLSRRTMRAILDEYAVPSSVNGGSSQIIVQNIILPGFAEYHALVMEESYNEDYQLESKVGDLLFFTFITYGYGDIMLCPELIQRAEALSAWTEGVCEKYHCKARIFVTANYW